MFKDGILVSKSTYHDGKIIEEKKAPSKFLKIDTDFFNDSRSRNTSKFSFSNSRGSDGFDMD